MYSVAHYGEQFLSTPSARRATQAFRNAGITEVFLSTPSARRATSGQIIQIFFLNQFLSTPSARRATPTNLAAFADREIFLSTPSARRATIKMAEAVAKVKISIHALREEGDISFTRPT